MMIFRTLIRNDGIGERDYVQGRISGFQELICESNNDLANYMTNSGMVIGAICTQESYEKFKDYVEYKYPGICEFYYEN